VFNYFGEGILVLEASDCGLIRLRAKHDDEHTRTSQYFLRAIAVLLPRTNGSHATICNGL
jgi:hypothetical protein